MLDYDIRKMYEDMEIRLIKSMKRNLQRHLDEEDETGFKYPQWQAMKLKELKRYQRQNRDIIGNDTKGFSSSISKYLKRELREGSYNALKEYRDAMGDKYKANKTLSNSFFKINDKKVNTLIKSVNNDLKTANRAVLRMTNDQYRQVIFKSQMYVANGVMTPKQAIDAANQEFLRRGLNVIEYKDGKRVNIASYSQMAVRTAGTRAMLMGEGAFRKSIGQHLIRISSHGTSCELCIPWQGKVLIDDVYSGGSKKDGKYPLLSEAMDQGLFHPNCRHGHSTFSDGKDDISDINESYANGKDGSESDAQYQDDMNYINRKIQEYRRLSVGSIDENNIKMYKNKLNEWKKVKPIGHVDIKDSAKVRRLINKFEKEILPLENEHAYVINNKGGILRFIGNAFNIDIPEWYDLSGAIITHNHLEKETNYSLSPNEDIMFFFKRNVKELRGIDFKYKYFMRRRKNTKVDLKQLEEDIRIFTLEAYELSDNNKLNIDVDGYDYINKKLSEKYNYTYSRKERK